MIDRQRLFEVIAQEAIYGIAVFEEDGVCAFINRVGQHLLDRTNPLLQDLVPIESRPSVKGFQIEYLKYEGLYQDVLVRKGLDSVFIGNVGCKHLQLEPNKRSYLLMIQDVTMQKKMQREIMQKQIEIKAAHEDLLKQNRQLKQLDNAKNRFIALTTHELRTPLSAMCASIDILRRGLYDSPEQLQEFIAVIHEQGFQLQSLVNDILDFAKIQAGKMDFFIQLQDPEKLAQAVLQNFEAMAESQQIQLQFVPPKTPVSCFFDEIRLRQILSNILNNAIKFNRKNGKVRLYFSETPDVVRISVEDNGQGIHPENYDKVFNEFETVEQVNMHHKGTGLGMPISRKLAQGMGGELSFDSNVGKGTTFWVEIPKSKVLENESLYQARPDGLSHGSGSAA